MRQVVMVLLLIISASLYAGDAEKGKTLAASCAACHGSDGNSSNPIWPSLAGQHELYIERQLKLFKNGLRASTMMGPMVAGLQEQDMADIAAYFSSQKPKLLAADPDLVELGQKIYQGGLKDRNIPACMACHGPTGQGNPLSGYPVVAGQNSVYMENELMLYKNGRIIDDKDDVNGKIMADVVRFMSNDEIKAVSSYMQGLKAAE